MNFYADNGPVFTMNEVDKFVAAVKATNPKKVSKRKYKKSYQLYNIPCAFDIETTSMKIGDKKVAFMYIWMFGINGISIYGRTWDEFLNLLEILIDALGINQYNHLVCYVHNLGYEFQFMRKYFEWEEVFSIKERSPIYATTVDGIEFRCSYMLTGTKLEKVGEDLLKYKCSKMVGDLDYSLIRGPKTEINDVELGYCINDIRVVMCKIKECIESESNNIGYIPMTKTGYVRRDVRKAVKADKKTSKMIDNLILTVEEYKMLKSAFQGGFTHANLKHSCKTMLDVVSYDFTSSYPTVMCSEKFPMGNGRKVEPQSYEDFMFYLQNYCCLFTIQYTNIKLKNESGDAPLSVSKCNIKGDKVIDNGRIREASEVITTITDVDYLTYGKFYNYDDIAIIDMYIYAKGYLPKPIVEKCLEYYVKKTTLKDVVGSEEDYQLAKANLNSIYGMMVMEIIRAMIEYDNDWFPIKKLSDETITELLNDYNEANNRFTWYPWGVWITAYARYNLFTGIYECGNDYIYSDTDSIKIINCKNHESYILEYNKIVTDKIEACAEFYGLDKSMICPMTVEGKKKPLGVWDFDGHYKRFKTLGAKRYMVETDDDHIKLTVAGLGKKAGAEYFSQFEDPFKEFKDGVEVPAEKTGKNTHTYIDDEMTVEFVDYKGKSDIIKTLSGVHMEAASFSIGFSNDYEYLLRMMGLYDSDMYA